MSSLSVDLRERVITAIENGMRITAAAKSFRVARRSIYNWIDLRKETLSLAPKTGYQKGHSHKITDWENFKIFAEANYTITSPEMAVKWSRLSNTIVSEDVIQRGLKKINFTAKKNFLLCRSKSTKAAKILRRN